MANRICELIQVGTETVENLVPILDEEGNETGEFETVTKEVPIMKPNYRDMTASEMAEQQKAELQPQTAELSNEDKLALMLDSIPTVTPSEADGIELPFKVGYKWVAVYENNAFAWKSVKDDNAIGTVDNPIYYADGVALLDNAFYIKEDGKIYVYMNGTWVEW